MAHPSLASKFPLLEALGEESAQLLREARQQGSHEVELPVEPGPLLEELKSLLQTLSTSKLPMVYGFAPYVPAGTPMPYYTQRRLPTGNMEAGFDVCLINRNWDGLDRIDDLTTRDSFEDIEGEIRIHRVSLRRYLGEVLERWCTFLERVSPGSQVAIKWVAGDVSQEKLALEILTLADRWRRRYKLPDYRAVRLEEVEEIFARVLRYPEPQGERDALGVGTYLAEVMRALWGGFYRPLNARDERHKEPLATPAIALELPFGETVYPLEKVMAAHKQKRKLSLQLHLDVLGAHRRQSALQDNLARQLHAESLPRRRAAVRILCDIADARLETVLIDHLSREQDPDLLLRILSRLYQAGRAVPSELLSRLALHADDGVAARSIAILGRQKANLLIELLPRLLTGGERIPLRPIARQALEQIGTREARRTLRKLGPIPLLAPGQSILPGRPNPEGSLKLTAEILEDCANPAKQEAALRIFTEFADREEDATYGAALADPERSLRTAAVGLLAGSDRHEARQWLQMRMMFEQDPFVRTLLKEALSPSS